MQQGDLLWKWKGICIGDIYSEDEFGRKMCWGQGSPEETQAPTKNPWRYWELSWASTFGEIGMQDNFMCTLQVLSTQVSLGLGGYLAGSCLSYSISYIMSSS